MKSCRVLYMWRVYPGAMALSITTFSKTTLNIMTLGKTDILQHLSHWHSVYEHSAIMLNVIMLSATFLLWCWMPFIMLSVVMLTDVAIYSCLPCQSSLEVTDSIWYFCYWTCLLKDKLNYLKPTYILATGHYLTCLTFEDKSCKKRQVKYWLELLFFKPNMLFVCDW